MKTSLLTQSIVANGGSYTLPIASSTTLGGVKVDGTTITANANGVITAVGSGAVDSVNGKTGAVVLTKADLGLENVDNTSDLNKPISTATQSALNLKANSADVYTKSEVDSKLDTKQNTLSTEQLNSVNSGITAEHVATYNSYAAEISSVEQIANKADTAAEVAQQTANLIGQTLQQVTEKIPTTASATNLLVDTSTLNTGLADKVDLSALSAVATSGSYNDLTDKPAIYTLPTASASVLGGVKVGSGLTINSSGVLSTNGGSSSMLVIEPTPVVYESLTWNQVLEKAFDVNSFYGLLFNSSTPSALLADSASPFTLSNTDISIMVSADTVTVTVGAVSRNIYENSSWDSESDVVIKDEGVNVGIKYINDTGSGTVSLDFVHTDTGDPATAILDTTGASSIKNISSVYVFFKTSVSGDTSSIEYFINNANITCTNVVFDSTFENNLVNDTYVTIGASYDSSLVLQSGSGECIVGGTNSSFYNSDWQPTSTNLGNGCSWDLSTHTLTFPTPLKLWVESSPLSNVSNNIIFKIKTSGGEIILPDASNYSNQLAEIKDTINNVDLIIYSTGTEWKFASDVLQLSQKQFDSIPTEGNSLYGISVENRWCLDPNSGLSAKIHTGSDNWSMTYYQGQFSQNTIYNDSTTHISSFMSNNYNVTSSNSTITFNVEPSIYLSTILINVSDTVPTVTFADAWSTGATFIFKQDGTVVSSLTFAQNTYYKLTLNGANFNEQYVIFVDCQSYTKSV